MQAAWQISFSVFDESIRPTSLAISSSGDAELWRLHQAEELMLTAGYVKQRDGSFRKSRPSSRAAKAARSLAFQLDRQK